MSATPDNVDFNPLDFAPGILAIHESPPSPLPRTMLWTLFLLFGALAAWTYYGKLDIVAVAEGKLVPKTYLKIVQPAEGGILKEILVDEGDHVSQGQVLMRLDRQLSEADTRILQSELAHHGLQLQRVDAEINGTPFEAAAGSADGLRRQVVAQYLANRRAHADALGSERAALSKAKEDLAGAEQVRAKLASLLPTYMQEEEALKTLGDKALASKLEVIERQRKRIEAEQDLKAQARNVASLQASISQSEKRLAQITSNHEQQLHNERIETQAQLRKIEQELAKQEHRNTLLELKAPQNAVVKDLATHTLGAVVSPGTVLLTLVPSNEALQADVMVRNQDIGFVREGQIAKLKFAAYPFQKYGLVEGRVVHVGADANEHRHGEHGADAATNEGPGLTYKAIVELRAQEIAMEGVTLALSPGMQVTAEFNHGRRSVLDYLLSPVRRVVHEAGRER